MNVYKIDLTEFMMAVQYVGDNKDKRQLTREVTPNVVNGIGTLTLTNLSSNVSYVVTWFGFRA